MSFFIQEVLEGKAKTIEVKSSPIVTDNQVQIKSNAPLTDQQKELLKKGLQGNSLKRIVLTVMEISPEIYNIPDKMHAVVSMKLYDQKGTEVHPNHIEGRLAFMNSLGFLTPPAQEPPFLFVKALTEGDSDLLVEVVGRINVQPSLFRRDLEMEYELVSVADEKWLLSDIVETEGECLEFFESKNSIYNDTETFDIDAADDANEIAKELFGDDCDDC